MSIRQGDKVLAGKLGLTQNLFDFKWSDHILNDLQWLRADTFSWQDGELYEVAYQHLIDDLTLEGGKVLYGWGNNYFTESATPSVGDTVYISNAYGAGSGFYFINSSSNNSVKTVGIDYIEVVDVSGYQYRNTANDTDNARVILPRQSETIAETSIYYFQAADGHKIVLPSQEANVEQIFLDTGVAWYYIIDTTNQRFKLPRTKFGFVGLRDTVGNYVTPGLPNITGYLSTGFVQAQEGSGAFSVRLPKLNRNIPSGSDTYQSGWGWDFSASNSNTIYGASTTVQSPATQMYLYFFVGNFTQTALENMAGISAEMYASKQDISTALNYDNISNCITAIQQDIKLELNNGTLTLKAGSKVYVPNGVGVFDIRNIITDKTYSITANGQFLVFVTQNLSMWAFDVSSCTSGTTPAERGLFYNTNNNSINSYYNYEIEVRGYSFPIAKVTVSGGTISSIDQVFNGFGYIGSTVFGLPGVKGLIPDGRNPDGTLNNIEFTLSSPITMLQTVSGWNGSWSVYTNGISLSYHPTELEYISDTKPIVSTPTAYWFCPKDNILYWTSDTGATWSISKVLRVANLTESSMKIQSLNWKQPFKAVDWNDSNIVSGWAMPSNRYINLTLGASGTEYTAPADGYVSLAKASGTSGTFFNLFNKTKGIGFTSDGYQTGNKYLWIPVAKGDIFTVSYTFSGSTTFFRFIYANGAK